MQIPTDEEIPDELEQEPEPPEPSEEEEGPQRRDDPQLAEEPLFTALLRQTVQQLHRDDPVWQDIVGLLATPISLHLAAKQAKGGDFAASKRAQGADAERYSHDQSLRAHLVNGLFPVLHIGDLLREWGAPQFRRWDEESRRLFVAGFLLHDWIKLPDVQETLKVAGLTHDPNPNLHLPTVEQHFREWIERLRLDEFLAPLGGAEPWLHDLIFIAVNTQEKWGTLLNRSALPRLRQSEPRRMLVTTLCTLSDRLSYSAHTPAGIARHDGIVRVLENLSDGEARLTFHHVTENRGVLTNLLHNAALDVLEDEARVPILYAPSGVVYLERISHAPPLPDMATVAERVVAKTEEICAGQVSQSLAGFRSSPTGFRFPDFYWLFFDLPTFVEITPRAAIRAIPFAKKDPFSEKRLADAERKGLLPDGLDVSGLPRSRRVDQLAELLQLWVRLLGDQRPTFPATDWLFERLGIEEFRPSFDGIVTGGATGGVAYNWYVAAAVAAQGQPGLDDAEWEEWLNEHASVLVSALREEAITEPPDRWAHLRAFAAQTIRLDDTASAAMSADFVGELAQYSSAKRKGRGTTNVCSLCASTFPVEKQTEPAVLFAPAVYSNRLAVHGSKTQRNICAICGLEMMLRKLLMTHTQATGGAFEGRKERYLFFYPAYFFTPETLAMLRRLYRRLQKISITALRKLLVGEKGDRADVRLDPGTLQKLEDLLLAPKTGEEMDYDPLSRLHYPERAPMMFDFIGIPPGRDAKETEAWIHPALLALLLPLQLDVKVVASESPIPLFTEASDFRETTFLDAPAAAVRYVLGTTRGDAHRPDDERPIADPARLTLDDITRHGHGALQRLLVAYFVHTDAHAGIGQTGFDYRWQQFPALARDLASTPLTLFHYLKKWQRRSDVGLDGLPLVKVQQYLSYYRFFDPKETFDEGGVTMSHARTLTELYRQFYRAEGYKSNAVLRPLTVASKAISDADPRLFGDGRTMDAEALEEVVWGEVQGFVNRVRIGSAQGLAAPGTPWAEADGAVKRFARYFVHELFMGALKGDVAAMRGRQLNLLKNACEVLYNDADAPLRAARRAARAAKLAAGQQPDDDELSDDKNA